VTRADIKYSPLQGYMTFLDALHVEADSGDGATLDVSAWVTSDEMTTAGETAHSMLSSLRRKKNSEDDVLDGELASLRSSLSAWGLEQIVVDVAARCRLGKRLTARTLKSDVLPAF